MKRSTQILEEREGRRTYLLRAVVGLFARGADAEARVASAEIQLDLLALGALMSDLGGLEADFVDGSALPVVYVSFELVGGTRGKAERQQVSETPSWRRWRCDFASSQKLGYIPGEHTGVHYSLLDDADRT